MVIADLEVHSRYARACSKNITPQELHHWALRKGVTLLSTGDITHPLWRREISKILIEQEPGFFVLNEKYLNSDWPLAIRARMTQDNMPRFVLGGEVSLMFRQGDKKGRRVHLLFLAPSFRAVEELVAKINNKGKLASDGRVILSMSCKEFSKVCRETDPRIMVIPAHIWTPWFGLLGSKSGFDSIEEAFEDEAKNIAAYETGLSADPAMCWRVDSLNSRVLISSSDLHSPPNMMREATLLNSVISDYNYEHLREVLSQVGHPDYYGTLEFYPEEGKYHADGHAACTVILGPEKTNELNGRCPVCGQLVTVGVLHRVYDLANHPAGFKPKNAGQVIYMVPLQEIIAEALGRGKQSKSVQQIYFRMTEELGSEFVINHELDAFPNWVPSRIIEGIKKVRNGKLTIIPGYDGIYGQVKLFRKNDAKIPLWGN